ncbi:MAG: MFS transporter [Promethearchaeota archaeon]
MNANNLKPDSKGIEHTVEKHSNKTVVSYCFGNSLIEIYNVMFGTYVFFFYETEIGLYVWFITIAYVIYSLWNSINDPLLGYLFDKPNRLWKRWGKRFPWMVIAAIPWVFSMYFILTPPFTNPAENTLLIFIWMVIWTCCFDTFYSMFQNNHFSLFADKFRSDDERRKTGSLGWALGMCGTAIGGIIPPLLITYGDISSYSFMGLIIALLALVFFVLAIPGIRETKNMINRYVIVDMHKEKEGFFSVMKKAVKQKNFMLFVFLTFLGDVVFNCVLASIHYFVKYTIRAPASFATPLLALTIIGSIASVPLFLKLMRKINDNKKVAIIGSTIFLLTLLTLIFFWDPITFLICAFLFGIGVSAFKTPRFPVLSDTLDETVIKTGMHQESVYMGANTFFQRFSIITQAIIFALAHVLTGFDPNIESQTPLALFGIRMQAAIIPAIFLFIGIIVFAKYYDLTAEKTKENKQKLKEMGL